MASCLGGAHIRTKGGPLLNFVDPPSGEAPRACGKIEA